MEPYDRFAYQIDRGLQWRETRSENPGDTNESVSGTELRFREELKQKIVKLLESKELHQQEVDWLDSPSMKSREAKREEIADRRRRMHLFVDPEWEEPKPPVAPLCVVWKKTAWTDEIVQWTKPVSCEFARDVVAAQDRRESPDTFYYLKAEPEDYNYVPRKRKKPSFLHQMKNFLRIKS